MKPLLGNLDMSHTQCRHGSYLLVGLRTNGQRIIIEQVRNRAIADTRATLLSSCLEGYSEIVVERMTVPG